MMILYGLTRYSHNTANVTALPPTYTDQDDAQNACDDLEQAERGAFDWRVTEYECHPRASYASDSPDPESVAPWATPDFGMGLHCAACGGQSPVDHNFCPDCGQPLPIPQDDPAGDAGYPDLLPVPIHA